MNLFNYLSRDKYTSKPNYCQVLLKKNHYNSIGNKNLNCGAFKRRYISPLQYSFKQLRADNNIYFISINT